MSRSQKETIKETEGSRRQVIVKAENLAKKFASLKSVEKVPSSEMFRRDVAVRAGV
jgi:hypothetical protein